MSDREIEIVTNQLVELKDTSELSMNLAYSALLLNNTFLAEEVQLLYRRITDLNFELETSLISCDFQVAEAASVIGLIGMGMAAERISHAASDIAKVVLRGIEPHPVLKMAIESADETVNRTILPEKSSYVGKTLKEAQFTEKTGWSVLVIKRGDRWIRPKASTTLEAGDELISSGYSDGEEDFKELITSP